MSVRKRAYGKNLPETRKNEKLEDLLVFGYACKVFRDDERAQYIDQGRHLIPWMGDESIMIDRYDGRGHLFDLSPYDADVNKVPCFLDEEEERIEALCDEERYLELHTDVMEKALYEEEELKRLNEAVSEGFNAVGFSYENPDGYDPSNPTEDTSLQEEEEEVYEPPEELKVPPGIEIPETIKMNAIVEKTAAFISQHGGQMEIVIKAKQANNAQFDFLHFDSPLNPYYKHMVKMIKSGIYKPRPPESKRRDSNPETDEDEEHSHSGYLHPLLNAAKYTVPEPTPVTIPQLGSQIKGTSYAKLLNKFAKHTGNDSPSQIHHSESSGTHYPQEYGHYPPSSHHPHYMTHDPNLYGPSSNLPPPPGMEPVTLPSQPPPPGTVPPEMPNAAHCHSPVVVPSIGPQIVPPPPDLKPVIDRMAAYVIKEGLEFETQVKTQSDPRFEFLKSWHAHNAYYEQKKKTLAQEILTLLQEEGTKIAPKAVSFSIKPKEIDASTLEKKSGLPFHESSDEEDESKIPLPPTAKLVPEESIATVTEKPQIPTENIEKKMAEEKLKDKLALAAREKLAQASKEKQMQAERKRKAAMFLNMLKSTGQDKKEEGSGSELPHSRNESPSRSRTTSPNRRILSPSSSPPKRAKSPDISTHRRRKTSRSPLSGKSKRSKSSRSRSRSRSRLHKPRRSKSPKRKTPPKAFSSDARSLEPIKKRRHHHGASFSPESESRRKSRRKTPRVKKSHSKHSHTKTSRSRSKRSRSRSKRSTSRSRKERSSRRTKSNSSSSSSSDEEFIKSPPSPIAVTKLFTQGSTASSITVSKEQTEKLSADDSSVNTNNEDRDDDSKQVSDHMLSKVRAMLKASREAILKEEVSNVIDLT